MDKNSNTALEISDQQEYNYYLTEAPIEEFAKYTGKDIDEAVKMRVEAAVKSAPLPIDVTVRPIEPMGNLLGFANVTIGGMTVNDFKIVEGKDGSLFVGVPSKPDSKSKTGYRNTVYIDPEFKEAFNDAVINEYYNAVEKTQSRAANMRGNEKPARIADQMEKAGKEAAKHNAEKPNPVKDGKVKAERE